LDQLARENLRVGEQVRLDDGTTVRFDGVQRWVNLQVSHDPFQVWTLAFAIAVSFGISASLSIKRRRIWVRAVPVPQTDSAAPQTGNQDSARTVVEVGGLARTDQAGYGEEFTKLAGDVLGHGHEQATSVRGRTN